MIRVYYKILDIETLDPVTDQEFPNEGTAIEWMRNNPGNYFLEYYREWNS